jgi:hypothetical protein
LPFFSHRVELLQKICRATGKAKKIFSESLMAGQARRGAARMQRDEGNAKRAAAPRMKNVKALMTKGFLKGRQAPVTQNQVSD